MLTTNKNYCKHAEKHKFQLPYVTNHGVFAVNGAELVRSRTNQILSLTSTKNVKNKNESTELIVMQSFLLPIQTNNIRY